MQEVILKLLLATFLGALIGVEREYKRKGAGLRTFSLVCLGTCIFTIITLELMVLFRGENSVSFDPSRIVQAVAVGIGFIGAGVIFHQSSGIVGLTTAAGLWISSAIGIAVGAGLYFLALFSTFLAIFILAGFGLIEEKILGTKEKTKIDEK